MTIARLTGYRLSAYTWAARLALCEAGAAFEQREADPFTPEGQVLLAPLRPFGRVPLLEHDGFAIWETAAILEYVDGAFADGALVSSGARARARMRQVIGIVDAYGYWPMVRQVFSERVFAPFEGRAADEAAIAQGMARAAPVLGALEQIAAEGLTLAPGRADLASCHFLPMAAYFVMAPEGRRAMEAHPALMAWYEGQAGREAVLRTRPDFAALI